MRYAAYCMDASQYVKLAMQGGQSSSHDHRGQFSALAAEVDRIQKVVNDVCPSGTDWCIVLVNREKGIYPKEQLQLHILVMYSCTD